MSAYMASFQRPAKGWMGSVNPVARDTSCPRLPLSRVYGQKKSDRKLKLHFRMVRSVDILSTWNR